MVTTLTQADVAYSLVLAHGNVSYVLGPLDESSLGQVAMQSERGYSFVLLVPAPPALPAALPHALAFHEGAAAGYDFGDGDLAETPVQVVNFVYSDFFAELYREGSYPWMVGWLLGLLSALAEEKRQLALVGIAHLCFLVARVPDCSHPRFHLWLNDAGCLHNAVVRAYRRRVQALKARGMPIEEAWSAALAGGCASNGLP